MFTGIIEMIGIVDEVQQTGSNKTFWISSPMSKELSVDQSVSHNGVCLTIEEVEGDRHRVTAIKETLDKSNIDSWVKHDKVNLERCLALNGRLDGHMVQGHVDTTGICINTEAQTGSWVYTFEISENFAELIVEKGSVSLNGISLTIFNVTINTFSVAIIPYTYEHTTMQDLKKGSIVNIEFDIIGKYVQRSQQLKGKELKS